MNFSRCLVFALLAAATIAAAKDNPSDITVQQKYRAGGSIHVQLESGGYSITGTDSENITITYGSDSVEQTRRVKVNIQTTGSAAEISIRDTPNNNFHAEIEIPRQSGLWLRLTAGDLSIRGVQGDQEVEAHAGNIDIQIPHPEQYGHVDGSALAGDLDASAFNISKSGLFRSFKYQGKGKYRLHTHLAAGNLTIRE